MGRRSGVLMVVCAVTAMVAGCSGRAIPASAQSPAPASPGGHSFASPGPSTSPTASSSAAAGPALPASTARQLPGGAFYLLAGRDLGSLNVWEVTPDGRERLLTRGRPGYGIDGFAASQAGIVLAEAARGVDNLARLTSHGPAWLRPGGSEGALLHGSSPDIRGNGMIGYVTPPGRSAGGTRADFAIWIRHSFTGRGGMLLHQRGVLDGPVFGPDGRIAVEGWVGPAGHRRPGIIIYSHGPARRLSTGVSAIPSLVAWGEHAPAVALAFPAHDAELLYPDGHRQRLPSGWQPLAWNPSGSQLLMQSATALGSWSVSSPGQVTRIGPLSPGVQILEAAWLDRKAPL